MDPELAGRRAELLLTNATEGLRARMRSPAVPSSFTARGTKHVGFYPLV